MSNRTLVGFDRAAVVESAARALVSVSHSGSSSHVTLPLFYPSGTAVTVEVAEQGTDFYVTDIGLSYREVEQIGGEHLFARNAKAVAETFSVEAGKVTVRTRANREQLFAAIADVAAASVQIAHRVCERMASRNEAEIAANLYERLVRVFGAPKVERDVKIAGASSHQWRLSALVHVEGRDVAFEAVSTHHSSVYSSATMFHDISLLDRKPVPVAVVRDKSAMGPYLSILAQAAHVIQDNVPDDALNRLAVA